MLKLKSRELPLVQFRAVLPEWLGPGTDKKPVECFIEVDARAGGPINSAYIAATEKLMLKARLMERVSKKVTDDEKFVAADYKNAKSIGRGRFENLYDACVIEWRSNIQTETDDGTEAITCDRATFIALTEQHVPEIAKAMTDLETDILAAGKLVEADDEETEKN